MSLIDYTQLQDGQDASSNGLNERFGKIIDTVNGNIDTENIKNGAVTREKIADGSINKNKLSINLYIDDNGWTVTDMGGIKTYSRVVTVDGSQPDGNGSPGAVGYLIGGNGQRRDLAQFPPPVGRTNANIAIVGTYFGGYSGHLVVSGEMRGSEIMIAGGNIWPSQLSFKGRVFVQATELI